VKLINEILNEENKLLKRSSNYDINACRTRLEVKPDEPSHSTTVQPHSEVQITYSSAVDYQYSIPVANRYDTLTNQQELQEHRDTIFHSQCEQSTNKLPTNTHEHVMGLSSRIVPAMDQHRWPPKQQQNILNLQEQRINEEGTNFIPTIVNGVSKVNLTSVPMSKIKDSTKKFYNEIKRIN